MTGRKVTAAECERIGLCEQVVPTGQARAAAEDLAHRIAAFPQICVRVDRRSVYLQHDLPELSALERDLAQKYGIAWRKPTAFPRPAVYPMRVAAAHPTATWIPEFCKAIFSLNFAEDQDINDNTVCVRILDRLGQDGEALVKEAQTDENKARLRLQSEEAQRRKIFGAPFLLVGDEMFWGNDRLEDALEYAKTVRA